MTIDPEVVELTADVVTIFLSNTSSRVVSSTAIRFDIGQQFSCCLELHFPASRPRAYMPLEQQANATVGGVDYPLLATFGALCFHWLGFTRAGDRPVP